MFQKHGFEPAFAGVTQEDKYAKVSNSKRYESVSFNSSETDDFNSFSSGDSPRQPKNSSRPPKNKRKKTVTLEVKGSTVFKLVAIIVAAVLLVVLGVFAVISMSKPKDIRYEENSFAAFQAIDGSYRVSMNGKIIKDVFESEVELTVAKDNSFAYVCAIENDAKNVYILDNEKLTIFCEGAKDILKYSELVPGVIYSKERIVQDGGVRISVQYLYDRATTTLSKSGYELPENFVISPDGTAVAYTIKNKNDSSIDDLYVYTMDQSFAKAVSTGTISTVPVSIANGGDDLLAYMVDGVTKYLYHITDIENSIKRYRINDLNGSFNAVTATNSTGTETVFTTNTGTEYHSYIYDFDMLNTDTNTAVYFGKGYSVPQITDSNIVYNATFKKSYFQNLTSKVTFYVNNKYDPDAIAASLGQFSPDMKYFYCINETTNVLIQYDLAKDVSEPIYNEASDFVITQKGNIYFVTGDGVLHFKKLSQRRADAISENVTSFYFYEDSNELYFERIASVEAMEVLRTTEGSNPEMVKFGKTEITELPIITNTNSKKSYAYIYNKETDNYLLYYTSTGSSFKLVAECTDILSDSIPEDEEQIEDIIDDIVDEIVDEIEEEAVS